MRISLWGLTSVLFLVGHTAFALYNEHLRETSTPLVSTVVGYEICVVMQMSAVICATVAVRRGGAIWWLFIVLTSSALAVSCYLGEV